MTREAILDALLAAEKNPDRLNLADLGPVGEFHIGGRQATVDFAEQLGAARGTYLLGIGFGLGGGSRYFAHRLACRVAGIAPIWRVRRRRGAQRPGVELDHVSVRRTCAPVAASAVVPRALR